MSTCVTLLHSEQSGLLLLPNLESWYLFQECFVFLWLGTFFFFFALNAFSQLHIQLLVFTCLCKTRFMTFFLMEVFLAPNLKQNRTKLTRNIHLLPVSQLPECHGKTRPNQLSRWAAVLVHWGSTGECWRQWHILPVGRGWSQCTSNTCPCTWQLSAQERYRGVGLLQFREYWISAVLFFNERRINFVERNAPGMTYTGNPVP